MTNPQPQIELVSGDLEYYELYRSLLVGEYQYAASHNNYGMVISSILIGAYFTGHDNPVLLPIAGIALAIINIIGWVGAISAARYFHREWYNYIKGRGLGCSTDGTCKLLDPSGKVNFPPLDSKRWHQLMGLIPGILMQAGFIIIWIVVLLKRAN